MTDTVLLNKPRALQFMRDCGLDAIIASSAVNVGYFSGYFCWINSLMKEYMARPGASSNLPEAYAILTLDGNVSLVVTSILAADAAQLTGVDVYTFGPAGLDFAESPESCKQDEILWELVADLRSSGTPMAALVKAVAKRGLTNAQIGLDMDGMPLERREAFAKSLPHASLKDCSRLILLIRAVKSPEEIRRLTRAAEIAESACLRALTATDPGTSMIDVVQKFRTQVAAMGAEFDHFAFSPRGFGIATESDYRFMPDDVLYVDFGCKFDHYFSDTGLTLALTTLSQPLKLRYDALHDCMAAGIQSMRPGAEPSQVQKAMSDEFAAHGLGPGFPHGHGLGLEVRDHPILVQKTGLQIRDDCINVSSDIPLEEGMVINLEAFVFLPGAGSVHMERSFVVTAESSRELIRQDRDQPHFSPARQ